jgi:ATP-dependent exoDNAse (exonuclease V) beta subunit
LRDSENEKILYLPMRDECTEEEIISGVASSIARIETKKAPELPSTCERGNVETYTAPEAAGETVAHPPYFLRPSEASGNDFNLTDGGTPEVIKLGERLNLTGAPDMALVGDCVHAFLAVDRSDLAQGDRQQLAARTLKNWAIDALTDKDLVEAADRLYGFIQSNFPDANVHRELPVAGRIGLRRVNGSIDMLVESPNGFIVIDHKTFPGRYDQWEGKALSHRAQLALYSYLVERATGKNVLATYIHMPVVGAIIKIDCKVARV